MPSPRDRSPLWALAVALVVASVAMVIASMRLGWWASVRSPPEGGKHAARSSAAEVARFSIGSSVEGRAIEAWRIGDAQGELVLLAVASIHGSEPAGTPVLERFRDLLVRAPERLSGKQVVIVPILNPDGLARGVRTNAGGVDLNRNFPADNRIDRSRFGSVALSEPESRALHDLIVRSLPGAIVSLHQPLECVDFDGPGEALADALAMASGLPVKKLGSRPGSLGAWFGETLGRPIVTLEFPRNMPDAVHGRYAEALAEVLDHLVRMPSLGGDPGAVARAARSAESTGR